MTGGISIGLRSSRGRAGNEGSIVEGGVLSQCFELFYQS